MAPKRSFSLVINHLHPGACNVCTMLTRPGVSSSSLIMLLHLCKLASTAGLDGIDLGLRPCHALEACGELGAVEEKALACLDRTKGRTGSAADAAGEVPGLIQRAVLLGLLAVAGKGLWQGVGWGGWVGLGGVVDLCTQLLAIEADAAVKLSRTGGCGALAQEADHGLASSLEDLGCVHCGMDEVELE